MTFVKRTANEGVVITPAAMLLSGLEVHELLEVQTLDGAVVMYQADAEYQDRLAIANELMRLAEALLSDTMEDAADELEADSVRFPNEIFESAGLDTDEYDIFSDDGIIMIVRKNQDFNISDKTRKSLHKYGVTPETFDCLAKAAYADSDDIEEFNWGALSRLAFETAVNVATLAELLKEKNTANEE